MSEAEKRVVDISEIFSGLVRDLLSYVDITIDQPDLGDKYSKRAQLKKQFNGKLYAVKEEICLMNNVELLETKTLNDRLDSLYEFLKRLSSAAIPDEVCRESFLALVADSIGDFEDRLREYLTKNEHTE